jgi:hypothetical protein
VFYLDTILIPTLESLNNTHTGLYDPGYNTCNRGAISIVSFMEWNLPADLQEIKFCASWRVGSWDRSNYLHTNFHAPVSYLGGITNYVGVPVLKAEITCQRGGAFIRLFR